MAIQEEVSEEVLEGINYAALIAMLQSQYEAYATDAVTKVVEISKLQNRY